MWTVAHLSNRRTKRATIAKLRQITGGLERWTYYVGTSRGTWTQAGYIGANQRPTNRLPTCTTKYVRSALPPKEQSKRAEEEERERERPRADLLV
jgi:hypothetical protein